MVHFGISTDVFQAGSIELRKPIGADTDPDPVTKGVRRNIVLGDVTKDEQISLLTDNKVH